jgi:hypothetical protein
MLPISRSLSMGLTAKIEVWWLYHDNVAACCIDYKKFRFCGLYGFKQYKEILTAKFKRQTLRLRQSDRPITEAVQLDLCCKVPQQTLLKPLD